MILFSNNKSKLNLCIDIIMLLLLIPVSGIGLLMKYVLVPGIERNIIYGDDIDLKYFGLSRHQWGVVHFTLSIFFLIMLILHIILHWKVIMSVFKQMIPALSIRIGITLFLIFFCLIILISPFFIVPEKLPFEHKHRNRIDNFPSSININAETSNDTILFNQKFAESEKTTNQGVNQEINSKITGTDPHNSEYKEIEVYGYQILRSVSEKSNIPVNYLANSLKIPENLTGQKVGFLRKQYSFTMTDVRKSISDYKRR